MKTKYFIPLLVFYITVSLTAQENTNQNIENKLWEIDNCVKEFSWDDTIQTNAGYQYWFFDKNFIDGRTIKMSVVAPHSATHVPHRHTEDEFFFVLEGTAEFYLAGEKKSGSKYSAFYCPSNIEHGIRNIGNTELKYLVIKKYETR
jgi:quercetin dioxygenase-like cupin family protein